jgi:hypothetical protein
MVILYVTRPPKLAVYPSVKQRAPMQVKVANQTAGLTVKSLAVFLRTARFNIQKFYMVLALCLAICKDLRKDSGFPLHSIDLLVFITVVESV